MERDLLKKLVVVGTGADNYGGMTAGAVKALEAAKNGKMTAMICSGDAGIYGQASSIFELVEEDCPADMFTTIFIGNSVTKNINGRMVTPGGCRHA